MSPAAVIFVRHAESEANAGLRSTDPALVSLTPRGRSQAKSVAELFREPPSLVITSRFVRTQQTAEPLLRRHPSARFEEWAVHEFTFLDPRRCEDTTYAERIPLVEQYWERADPLYRDGGASESFADFITRVSSVVDEMVMRREPRITVFSHGHFMKALLWLQSRSGAPVDADAMRSFQHFSRGIEIPNAGMLRGYVSATSNLFLSAEVGCVDIPPARL